MGMGKYESACEWERGGGRREWEKMGGEGERGWGGGWEEGMREDGRERRCFLHQELSLIYSQVPFMGFLHGVSRS